MELTWFLLVPSIAEIIRKVALVHDHCATSLPVHTPSEDDPLSIVFQSASDHIDEVASLVGKLKADRLAKNSGMTGIQALNGVIDQFANVEVPLSQWLQTLVNAEVATASATASAAIGGHEGT